MSTIRTALETFTEGVSVTVRGRVIARRKHGSVAFIDLDDRYGQIQVIIPRESSIELPHLGDIIVVVGTCCLSKSSVRSVSCERLSYAARRTSAVTNVRGGKGLVPRHLELLHDGRRYDFFARLSRFTFAIRSHLYDAQFLEFDTSTLQRRFNAGHARPFATTVNATGKPAFLRLTSELRLKQLMSAGYEKVFEMGKSFRNEGMDKMHHPEFTQLELYQAYAELDDTMSVVERLIKTCSTSAFGENLFSDVKPWPRIDLLERCRDLFGGGFSFSLPKQALLELGHAHLPKGKSLSPDSSLPQLYQDLIRKAVFSTVIKPSFMVGFPALGSPLAKRSIMVPDGCERAALVVNGRRVCDLAREENDATVVERALSEQSILTGRPADPEFLDALKTGIPPLSGASLGIERLALLAAHGQFDRPVSDAILYPLR